MNSNTTPTRLSSAFQISDELDHLSLIFKRCLKDTNFRHHFLQNPYKTMLEAGYRLPAEDISELENLAAKVRESSLALQLSLPAETAANPASCAISIRSDDLKGNDID